MKKLFLYVFLGLLFCNVSNALPKCKGDDVKKWTNCFGTKIYTGDDKYLGDGAKYEGEWKDGQYHGQGNIIWSDGATHVGNFEKGYQHGKGKFTLPDGMVEEGIFRMGVLNGKGKRTHPDGRVVQGTFTFGKLTEPMETKTLPKCKGKDTMKWTNCNGQATFDNLTTIYTGEWLNGYAHGKGTLIGPGSEKYVGQFQNGLKDGLGKQKYENDDLYEGWFKKGLRHGEGTLRNKYKSKFIVGIWEKDILVGCQDHIKKDSLFGKQCQPELKTPKIKLLLKQKNPKLAPGVKADVENYEDLLKGKYSCSDRTSDVDWDFSFSKISNKDYYVEADGLQNFGKPFAQWRDGHRLIWFKTTIHEDLQSLFMNTLSLRKSTKNYVMQSLNVGEAFGVLSKTDFERLHELFVKADKEKKKNFGGKKHIEYEHAFFDSAYKIAFAEDLNREGLILLFFGDCKP